MSSTIPPRTTEKIEEDIVRIDHALLTVSEIRSSLHTFTELVQSEQKGPNFVYSLTDRLKTLRRELSTLLAESENLKGALEYAQVKANENNFNWDLIRNDAEKEAVEEETRYREEDSRKAKEVGSLVKSNADYAYNQLSSIVLDRPANLNRSDSFFTNHVEAWLKQKPESIEFSVLFTVPERPTLAGSTCSIKVFSRKSVVADLELEYDKTSDTLIVHQYDIKSVKEQKHFWQDSQYLVFQKLKLLATSAFEDMLAYFAKDSLYHVLNWFASYHDLFTRPCQRCHKLLQFDSPQYKYLPPMVRTWPKRTLDDSEQPLNVAYHMRCLTEYKNTRK